MSIEIVPAILRKTYEKIEADWKSIHEEVRHIQIDITDGVFAGDGTYREISRFRQLPESEKSELHMMVHSPASFVDEIIGLNPARCVFHLESFAGTSDLRMIYETLRERTQTELALALNPESPTERLEEYLDLIDYVLFMGYSPGFANQPVNPDVFRKIGAFHDMHSEMSIAVDGHVGKDTVEDFVRAGATILYANTAIFGQGNASENLRQLHLLAEAATSD